MGAAQGRLPGAAKGHQVRLRPGGDELVPRGAATSLADLRSKDRSSFWYDAVGRQLYVKVYATDPGNPGRAIDWEELKVEPAPAG